MNAVELTQALVRCPSVTPDEGGALVLLDGLLREAGFATRRVDRNGVPNLYARYGTASPVFGFNGHTDVVPVGDVDAWTRDPFGGEIEDGILYGRGSCDMKSGVAAFVDAAIEFVQTPFVGSIVLLITGDEEGPGRDGTLALLDDLAARGEQIDHCIVGEPTSPNEMGEMIKIGRRGSLSAWFTAHGEQGHAAYPDRSANPIHPLIGLLGELRDWQLDDGYTDFQPSNLQIVSVDVGNPASNVIPAEASAIMNIRYNPNHNSAALIAAIDKIAARHAGDGVEIEIKYCTSGDAFLTAQGNFTGLVAGAVDTVMGRTPEMSTSGGTSDARFIKDHCPVVEVGAVGTSMHAVDEYMPVQFIEQTRDIYREILKGYFG